MFRARNRNNGEDVVTLGVKEEIISSFRELGRDDRLECPVCRKVVIVRAGEVKRPHFAHRSVDDCPLAREHYEILHARALLYEWLVSKFRSQVALEVQLEGYDLPKPCDCWVTTSAGTFAYWLIRARQPFDRQYQIGEALRAHGAEPHIIFHIRLLKRWERDENRFELSTTERAFMRESRFDDVYGARSLRAASLHYIDPSSSEIASIRGARCYSRPQHFTGVLVRSALEQMLVSPKTGELVHPADWRLYSEQA